MILIGTSGFSYADWVGSFYPAALPKAAWLAFYSRQFRVCELNFSYYRVPTAHTLARMVEQTGGQMEFIVKAHKEMTHERGEHASVFAAFAQAVAPLREARRLGAVLAQFPYSFHATRDNAAYLERFRGLIGDLPVVIEFRNAAWMAEATFLLLKRLHYGFCCVDEPRLPGLIPPLAVATSEIGYVRFHGRNREKWWQHEASEERYDYCYTDAELQEWTPKIRALDKAAARVYVLMNNHPKGSAAQNAKRLQELLDFAHPEHEK